MLTDLRIRGCLAGKSAPAALRSVPIPYSLLASTASSGSGCQRNRRGRVDGSKPFSGSFAARWDAWDAFRGDLAQISPPGARLSVHIRSRCLQAQPSVLGVPDQQRISSRVYVGAQPLSAVRQRAKLRRPLAQFQDLPRAVLVAISNLSGDRYRDVEGDELVAELRRQGHQPDPIAVRNLMERLRDDGYVTFSAAFGIGPKALSLIRLADRGRHEVEGWPSPALFRQPT